MIMRQLKKIRKCVFTLGRKSGIESENLNKILRFNCINKLKNQIKKSNLHYTRGLMPKRVTSCGAHLHGLASGLFSSEEMSQRWRAVGDTVPI